MGIRELHENVTAVVRRVRASETIEVTSDGTPVALLTPVPTSRRNRLIAEGRLIPPQETPFRLPTPVPPLPGTPTSEEIIADDRGD